MLSTLLQNDDVQRRRDAIRCSPTLRGFFALAMLLAGIFPLTGCDRLNKSQAAAQPSLETKTSAKISDAARRVASAPPAPATLLTPSSSKLDLGVMRHGERKEVAILLTNRDKQTVEITDLTTSCECVSVRLKRRRFEPGEKGLAVITVDFSKEKQFTGDLLVEVTGCAKARNAFEIRANVRVMTTAQYAKAENPETQGERKRPRAHSQ